MIKKLFILAMFLFMTFLVSGYGHADVLDFEDLHVDYWQTIPNGYGGFNWNSATQIAVANGPNWKPGSGYDNGAVSGVMVAYSYAGIQNNIDWAGSGTFDFYGAYFTSAWTDAFSILFEGYNNGMLSYTSQVFSLNTTNPLWVGLDWTIIDRLVIRNNGGDNWVMDNLTFYESGTAPIPEPATMLLLGSGLIGFAVFKKKKLK